MLKQKKGMTGLADGEGQGGGGGLPPTFFRTFKELLKKRCFQPPTLSHYSVPHFQSSSASPERMHTNERHLVIASEIDKLKIDTFEVLV